MPEPSGVEAEVLKRADALTKSGGLSFGDALSEVFAADPEVYARYAHGGTDLAPAPETPPTVPTLTPAVKVAASALDALTQEAQVLARTFAPHDHGGLGVSKARFCIAELRKLVLRQKGVAI